MASIVRGAESAFSSAGFSVLLTNSGGVPEVDAKRIEVLRQRQVDGLIVLPALEDDPATLSALRSTDTPIVVIDREMARDLHVHYVLSDHYSGVGAAARYLLQNGHRRLGLAIGRDVRPSRERTRAVMDAYASLRLKPDLTIDSGTLSAEHGELAMERFLEAARPRTAVILGGNPLLEGALRVVRRRSLRLGRHVSLVCCDDIALGRLYDPPIATVMRDAGLLGQRAAEMLLEQIESPHRTKPVVLPTWFELRGSCSPLER